MEQNITIIQNAVVEALLNDSYVLFHSKDSSFRVIIGSQTVPAVCS